MTTQTSTRNGAATAAHIVSDVFSPILMPTFAMASALWLTMMRYLPVGVRLWALFGVFAITAVVPFVFILILIKRGKVSDTSISDRSQRTAPYCASIICYLGAAFYLMALKAPMWLPGFFFGAATVSLLSLIITHWWKISAHVGAAGGVAAVIYWLAYRGMIIEPMLWVSVTILLVGVIAWARLYLDRHTPAQVLAGALMAFGVEYAVMCICS